MFSFAEIKKSIIKITIVGLFSLVFAFFSYQPVFASRPTLDNALGNVGVVATGAGVSSQTSVNVIVSNVIKTGLSVVGLLFFVLMLFGGFNWMIARGNESQIEKSKNTVISAVVGLVIVLAAYAITALVGTFMGA